MKPLRHNTRRTAHAHASRGLVLVIALILLAVVGLISTASIRLALNGDTASQAMRSNSTTQQAAEAALRWCELQVRQTLAQTANGMPPVFNILAAPADGKSMTADSLNTFTANAVQVPLNVLNNAGLVAFRNSPQCVAQRRDLDLPPGDAGVNAATTVAAASPTEVMDVVQATARAFSPDFSATAGSATGGDVWIRSTLIVLRYTP